MPAEGLIAPLASSRAQNGRGIQHMQRQSQRAGRDQQRHDACLSSSCSNSSRFGAISKFVWVTPVTSPPGRFRLATRPPSWTGSAAVSNTIGTVMVAAFAANAAGVLVAAMTAT
jgi:hypothetical protein